MSEYQGPKNMDKWVDVTYFYALDCGPCIYVGRTINMNQRLSDHWRGQGHAITKTWKPKTVIYREIHEERLHLMYDYKWLQYMEVDFACHIASEIDKPVTIGPLNRMPKLKTKHERNIEKVNFDVEKEFNRLQKLALETGLTPLDIKFYSEHYFLDITEHPDKWPEHSEIHRLYKADAEASIKKQDTRLGR